MLSVYESGQLETRRCNPQEQQANCVIHERADDELASFDPIPDDISS